MPEEFTHDVFLSYSAKDRVVVREIAERLKKEGLRVWFDKWEIKPGDNFHRKLEEGLEHSRVLVLCMSANAFDSDWTVMEAGAFRFRDPTNKERRFVPLRLDDAPIKGFLAQLQYINWLPADGGEAYTELLNAVREFAVKLSSIKASVRRVGARFCFDLEIESFNLSKSTLWSSGVTINVPTIDSPEKLSMIKLEWARGEGTVHQADPGSGEVWGFRDDGSFGPKPARCLLIEKFFDPWKQGGKIKLHATFETPWPRLDFHVRAWGNVPNAPPEYGTIGDPDWAANIVKDQQGVPAYALSIGY